MDRLDLMQAFRAVAEEGSFVAAAEKLSRSNKQVSKQVAALEEDLGVLLFQRTTRRVHLTDMGRAFLGECIDLLERQADLWQAIGTQNQTVSGTLRISAPLSFGELKVAPILPALLETYPDLRVQLNLSDEYVDLVETRNDVAIRIGNLEDSSLIVRKIGETKLALVASRNFIAQHGMPTSPTQLPKLATILDRNYRGKFRWPFLIDGEHSRIRVDARIEVNSPAAAKRFALAHCGIAMCPNFVVEDELRSGELIPVLSAFMAAPLGIYVVYPSNKHLSPKVRAFSDHAMRNLNSAI